jgi:hypothetical protein
VLAFSTTPTTRGADAPASIAPLAPIPKGQRLFFCGHSFHFHVPAMLDEIAKAAGFNDQVIVGKSMIGGSKSLSHWNVKDEANEAKKVLQAGAVDVLTLTPIYLPDDGIEKFAQLGLEYNPNLRVTVQEFWLPFDQYEPHFYDPPQIPSPSKVDHNAATGASLRAMHERYFDEMDAHIRAVNQKLGKQVLFVVPVGGAVIALREKIIAGEAPGLKAQEDLFTDALGHPTAPLQALITYVHYAVIYRKNPVGLPAPAILAQLRLSPQEREKLTRLLEELAWDTVTHHPLSGVSASQPPTSAGADTRDDASPWGMAAGADEMGYYAKCTPILHQAGVRWLRLFPEWQTIEPKHGQWNWEVSDKLVANARANNIHLMGLWYYFAP